MASVLYIIMKWSSWQLSLSLCLLGPAWGRALMVKLM